MRDTLLHRGPDGSGMYDSRGVSLAACRLAIVDLGPRGLMPMATPGGEHRIVFNGEIYNRLELRAELLELGIELHTTTDTEVVLRLYEREGAAMLDRLDGMFAFAIWDSRRNELFAARDRVGEKPFFYALHAGRLYFASEPKALFAAGVPAAFEDATWTELLAFGSVAGERTPYRGVHRLPAGHWLRAGPGRGLETGEWWSFARQARREAAPFGDALLESVRHRLIADVPVGTLLSGGLDSSSVTVLAQGLSSRQLPAFTVRYPGSRLDEGSYASQVADMTGVEHHELALAPDEWPSLLVDATRHLDEPITFPSCPELLAISRYARKYVRVLLTGEAADELFGGYTRLRIYRYPRLVHAAGRLATPFRARLRPGSRPARLVAAAAAGTDWIALVNADASAAGFDPRPLSEWAPYRAQLASAAVALYPDPVRQALHYERHTYLPAVLANADRMTMAASIEARMAFTAPDLLTLGATLRSRDLFAGAHGKQPIRRYMAERLPAAVVQRRKQGWMSPYRDYVRTNATLRQWFARVPEHEMVAHSPLGHAGARKLVDDFLAGDDSHAGPTWMLGRVVLWHQVCLEGRRDPFDGPAA